MTEVEYQISKFEKALGRLKEVLETKEDSDIIIDATIRRFEFTFEMAWKAIKKVLNYYGEDCQSPRNCIKKAFAQGWIEDEGNWLVLLDARNRTSHIYSEEAAREVYEFIKEKFSLFENLIKSIKNQIYEVE